MASSLIHGVTLAVALMGLRLGLYLVCSPLFARSRALGRRRVYLVEPTPGRAGHELRAALRLTAFDSAVFVLVHQLGLIHFTHGGWAGALATLACVFVWFELAYYVLHRALHGRWLYRLHRRHHEAHVPVPLSGLAFSLAERSAQTLAGLGSVALASRVLPVDQLGVEAYLVLSYILNFLGHTNLELLPPRFTRTLAGRVFITTTFHSMHHARFTSHFGLYTRVLDDLLGTTEPDYEEVQARAAAGQGLDRLTRRLAPSPVEVRPTAGSRVAG